MTILKNISTLVTVASPMNRRYGADMGEIGVIKNADVIFNEDKILYVGESDSWKNFFGQTQFNETQFNETQFEQVIDCKGKCVLPGFVDSHTHIVFSGDRADELAKRLKGVTYQEIAKQGGGIMKTMRAVRGSSKNDITRIAATFAENAFRHGTTTIEIKSGYGLDYENEIKLLEAIKDLQAQIPQTVVATCLAAHDFPPEYKENRQGYVNEIVEKILPKVKELGLAKYCDVFMDTGYFTKEETSQILEAAQRLGFELKLHADELSSFGAAELAAEFKATSADHLLCISENGIWAMKEKEVIATLLPGTAFYLGLQYAPAREMIKNGLCVALATDCNPGSNLCENMQMTLALACMGMKMTIEEAICAATINGAAAVGLADRIGSIELGKQADMLIFNLDDYPQIVYHYGVNQIEQVIKNGVLYQVTNQ